MEERTYRYRFPKDILDKKVIITALLIFSTLIFLASLQIAFGFALGVASSLLVFWLSWEGLGKLRNNLTPGSTNNKKRAQRIVVGGYLAGYFLLGVILWLGTIFESLNFYAVAGGFLMPQTYLRFHSLLGRK